MVPLRTFSSFIRFYWILYTHLYLLIDHDRYEIVEGSHELWQDVSKPYRETIRAFLAYFQDQVGQLGTSILLSVSGCLIAF